MKQRELQKIQTRKKIYETAIALFIEKSFEEVKITDIVEKAGVSVGTFYYHFPSKEDIIDEGYRDFDKELEKIYCEKNPKPGYEGIRFLVEHQIEDVLEKGVVLTSIFFKNQLGIVHEYYFSKNRFLYEKLIENISYAVQEKEKVTFITETILRIVRGTIYDWCLHQGNYDLKEVAMHDVELYSMFYQLK